MANRVAIQTYIAGIHALHIKTRIAISLSTVVVGIAMKTVAMASKNSYAP